MATYRFTKDEISIYRNKYGDITLSILLDGKYIDHTYMGYSKREAIKRFQQEYGTYPDDFTPARVLTLCNHGGLAIMEIIDEVAYVCDNYGNGYERLTKNRIFYSAKGYPYFTRNRQRYYLSDFMRTDIGKTSKPKVTYYTDQIHGGKFTYEEMVKDAKKNYDYGDATNVLTYMADWWKEHYKVINM